MMKEKVREFKKNQIVEEAIVLIYELGFHSATMDRLCEKLQVTKPFLYTYFDNKHALLIEIYDRMVDYSSSGIEKILETDARCDKKIYEIVKYLTKVNIELQSISAVYMQEERNLPAEKRAEIRKIQRHFDDELTNLIETGIEEGLLHVEYPRIAALSIFSMARWIHRWYRPGNLTSDQIAHQMAIYALDLLNCNQPHPGC